MSSHENICDGSGQVWLGSQPYGSPGESYAPCPGCPACRASGRQGCASRAPDIDPAPACVKYTGHLGPHVSEDGVWWVGRAVARWTMPSRQNSIASDTEAEMSDERRAEIEATLGLAVCGTCKLRDNAYCSSAFHKLADRLRDARGDDEAAARVRVIGSVHDWLAEHFPDAVEPFKAWAVGVRDARGGDDAAEYIACPYCSGQGVEMTNEDGGAFRNCAPCKGSGRILAARSPQGKDHEAGIEAARLKLPSAWRHDGTVDEGEALTRVMVAAYLSRVSAPKADEKQEAR